MFIKKKKTRDQSNMVCKKLVEKKHVEYDIDKYKSELFDLDMYTCF